jgi:hypothetical protein
MHESPTHDGLYLLDKTPIPLGDPVSHSNLSNRMASAGDRSFKFLPYQLSKVGYGPTLAVTGDGELGFDSGEGA